MGKSKAGCTVVGFYTSGLVGINGIKYLKNIYICYWILLAAVMCLRECKQIK